jgi:hypothetical protein
VFPLVANHHAGLLKKKIMIMMAVRPLPFWLLVFACLIGCCKRSGALRSNSESVLDRRSWLRRQAGSILLTDAVAPVAADGAPAISRRAPAVLSLALGTAAAAPRRASAAASLSSSSRVRIKTQPGLEYLEPIYELRLSIEALDQGLRAAREDGTEQEGLRGIQARLEKFFGGGIFSERNFYAGLAVQYMNQIVYDDAELKEYIRLDKEARFGSMEDALNGLEAVKRALPSVLESSSPPKDDETVMNGMADAKNGIDRWFELVPESDRKEVADLYVKARQADANRDGRLDDTELSRMDESSRGVWKRRIQVAGG